MGDSVEVWRRLREFGRQLTPELIEGTHTLYVARQRARGYLAPAIERDIAYGPHSRHRVDVHHVGAIGVETQPVFVFVHGGGYSSGDKQIGDLPFQDHVGGWAVRHGMVGVTMNYRLAPNDPWPAGAEDVGTVVKWLSNNIDTYGGDPGRIVVAGHSAGASHIAGCLAGQAGPIPTGIRAAILLSGVYDVAAAMESAILRPIAQSYFGTDEGRYPAMSTVAGVAASRIPTLIGVAELDPPPIHEQAWLLMTRLYLRDRLIPPTVWAPAHNHLCYVLGLGVEMTRSSTMLSTGSSPTSWTLNPRRCVRKPTL
jgi:acetyl esterase/lipase